MSPFSTELFPKQSIKGVDGDNVGFRGVRRVEGLTRFRLVMAALSIFVAITLLSLQLSAIVPIPAINPSANISLMLPLFSV